MSEILNDDFFSDETIPESLKLGLVALFLNGTLDVYKRGNGNISTYVINVGGGK